MSSIDPAQMAQQLATYDVQPFRQRYSSQTTSYNNQLTAIGKVESALRDFRTAIKDMNSLDSSVIKNSATTSQEGFFSADTNAKALTGSYQIFVEKVAIAHQVSTSMPTSITSATEIPLTGTLDFTVDSDTLSLDLSTIDSNSDGKNTIAELVKAINSATDNPGVNATLVRSGSETRLMLASQETGVANQINVSASTGETWFDNAFSSLTTISTPQDAVIWIGAQGTGLKMENSSNTYQGIIEGVDLTISKAQSAGEQPIGLKVGADKEATKEQLNKLVSAYNKLMSTIDGQTTIGDSSKKIKRGPLASDASIRSLTDRIDNVFRTKFEGAYLSQVGLSFDRNGKLSLDSKAFETYQAANPTKLEAMFNGDDKLFDSLENTIQPYLSFGNGLFKNKKESIQLSIDQIQDKQTNLDRKYEMSYRRYLSQYTQMNSLINQMNQTTKLFG